jgi:hypothetical protein
VGYELIFWRQQPGARLDPAETYRALINGKDPAGLDEIPIEQLLEGLAEAFPGAEREVNAGVEWLVWARPDSSAILEVTWSRRHLRADCRHLGNDEMNRVIDTAISCGCPLYDPQIGERFAFDGS